MAHHEWTPVKEHQLREAKKKAGWRWIAYFLTLVGLVIGLGLFAILDTIAPGAMDDDPKGVMQVGWFLGGMILLLAILLDVPAEKAAKEAKLLKVEKEMSLGSR